MKWKKCGANSTPCRIPNYAPVKMVTFQRGRLVSLSPGVCIMEMVFPIFNLVWLCAYSDFPALLDRFLFVCSVFASVSNCVYTKRVRRSSKLCREHQKLLFKMQKLDWKC